MALPTGDFGKNDGSLQYTSFASKGQSYGFEATYFRSNNIGLDLLVFVNNNRLDENRLIGAYMNSNSLFDTAFVSVDPFRTLGGMLGMYFDLPVTDFFSFNLKFLMGTYIVQKPAGEVRVLTQQSETLLFSQTETISSKFAILTGVGIKASPIQNWGVTIDAEYIGSGLEFVFNENGQSVSIDKNVKYFLISFGISYLIE